MMFAKYDEPAGPGDEVLAKALIAAFWFEALVIG